MLTIKFKNDARTNQIPLSIIEKCPNSPIYTYWKEHPLEEIELDMNYDIFMIILCVLNGTINYHYVSEEIKMTMDQYCLINDVAIPLEHHFRDKLNKKFIKLKEKINKQCTILHNFIDSTGQLVLLDCDTYVECKKIFQNKKNIIPIQLIYTSYDTDLDITSVPSCISIYDGLPIYRKLINLKDSTGLDKDYLKIERLTDHINDLSNSTNVNIMLARFHMFYKHEKVQFRLPNINLRTPLPKKSRLININEENIYNNDLFCPNEIIYNNEALKLSRLQICSHKYTDIHHYDGPIINVVIPTWDIFNYITSIIENNTAMIKQNITKSHGVLYGFVTCDESI